MSGDYVRSPHSNWTIQRTLGSGTYGKVALVERVRDGRLAALKYAIGVDSQDWKRNNDILKAEAKQAGLLKHPNIVKLLEAFAGPRDKFYIAYEFCPQGDLWHFVNTAQVSKSWVNDSFCPAMFDSLEYLDKQHIVHNDISPANILITLESDGKFWPKLNDFGLANSVRPWAKDSLFSIWQPPHWRTGNRCASDVYSLLIVVAWILDLRVHARAGWSEKFGFRAIVTWLPDLEQAWRGLHVEIAHHPVMFPLRPLFGEPTEVEFNPHTLSEGRAGDMLRWFQFGGRLSGLGLQAMIESTEQASLRLRQRLHEESVGIRPVGRIIW